MKIKLIEFEGFTPPKRAHENDAGADVYAAKDVIIPPHSVERIPLGFGIELPDGLQANIYPRSGFACKGIICQLPPIDSGYRGEVHAITLNATNDEFFVAKGTRIGQLVITPIILADFTLDDFDQRGPKGFGSTGVK